MLVLTPSTFALHFNASALCLCLCWCWCLCCSILVFVQTFRMLCRCGAWQGPNVTTTNNQICVFLVAEFCQGMWPICIYVCVGEHANPSMRMDTHICVWRKTFVELCRNVQLYCIKAFFRGFAPKNKPKKKTRSLPEKMHIIFIFIAKYLVTFSSDFH